MGPTGTRAEGTESGVLKTAGGGTARHPVILSLYQDPSNVSASESTWSFEFNATIPNSVAGSTDSAELISRTLRARLDPRYEQQNSVLRVRFSSHQFAPGCQLCIQGWWELASGVSADVLRAWLRVSFSGSTWKPHAGGGEQREEARASWLASAPSMDVTIDLLPAPGHTATAGARITVQDARNAILNRPTPFRLHDRSVEQERVGKEDGSGNLVMRTIS